MINHWDLNPGETVTLLTASGTEKRGYFVCRDTTRASFMLERHTPEGEEGELQLKQFHLRGDGQLQDVWGADQRLRTWIVLGQSRNTRTSLKQPFAMASAAAGGGE